MFKTRCMRVLGILLLGLACCNMAIAQLTFRDARIHSEASHTRLVLAFNQLPQFHSFSLGNPQRFVLDLSPLSHAFSLAKLPLKNAPIKAIRTSLHQDNTLRVVFDLSKKIVPTAFVLASTEANETRLVIDFPNTPSLPAQQAPTPKKLAKKPIASPATPAQPAARKALPKPVVELPWRQGTRDVIVIIDPGHGGKDPGATGPRGTHEKNVVLAISKDLATFINKQPGMKAVLTRRGDYYLTLRQRLKVAREHNGDIFVAIHADAYHKRSSRGASVYALSQRGASSEAARWLAAKENYSELGGVNLEDKSDLLRSVLIDLSQTATIGSSLQLGSDVLHALKHIGQLHRTRVEQAPFVVLKSPDIPSILIETGFISNPIEERRLNSSYYQKRIASAIFKGMRNYFWVHAPPGTMLANERGPMRYVVKSGDNLSVIASRFAMSVQKIKAYNQLQTSTIRRGQILKIPPLTQRVS